ncbi:MAG: bifunctional 3-(3-hydroxy-phenyl)propionate/3-hydroxycinnamic acid hydroxylase [Halieaceae bacterium]
MTDTTTSVVIVGAGPVGLMLAHQLGSAGVATTVLELAAELSDEPRAVVLDPESLRSLQGLDLLPALQDEILFGVTGDYLNGAGEVLFEINDAEPGPLGYPNLNGFNQPGLVRILAAELSRYDCVQLLFQHELEAFSQSDEGVELRVRDAAGDEHRFSADYLVGCDGGRSTVRAGLGVKMQGESNPQPWLVIDTREKNYDGEASVRFYCDPARPGMFIQTPHDNRRWEWMLLPGEDREQFLQDDTINELIAPFVNLDEVEIYRRRVYDFHAIIADKFQQGRVFLAGDAAHMTPPFAGQGLNSGLRDAANLGWKLAACIQWSAPTSLLESYESERWQHAQELINVAVQLGNDIQPIDPDLAAVRDAGFAALRQQPEAMEEFQDAIFKPMLDRYFAHGAAVDIAADALSGRMVFQPLLSARDGSSSLLDEVAGPGFSIIGYNCDPAELIPADVLAPWLAHDTSLVRIEGAGSGGDLHDDAGYFAEILADSDASMLLIRPDRFCMASFNDDNATDKLARAAAMLGF